MQAAKMAKLYPESFASKADAQRIVDIERAAFPEIFQWQDRQKERAHLQRFLLTKYGWIRWFWSMRVWNEKFGKEMWGPDAESAIAFEPANDAFGIIRECLLDFHEERRADGRTLAEAYHLANNVHDSIECFPEKALAEECTDAMVRILTKPRPTLIHPTIAPQGLWCDVEISTGPDMANLQTIINTQDRWLVAT